VVFTFSIEAIHHTAYELKFVLETEVDEVGVDQYSVWGYKSGVMLQKEGRGDRGTIIC
jgi:hypothetical protein